MGFSVFMFLLFYGKSREVSIVFGMRHVFGGLSIGRVLVMCVMLGWFMWEWIEVGIIVCLVVI